MASIWISTLEERDRFVGWLIFTYVFLTNIVFLAWWLQNYFGFLKKNLRQFWIFLERKFRVERNKILIQIRKKTSIPKRNTEISKTKDFLFDRINKLKILNSLLRQRIRELELDLINEDTIAGEMLFDQPPTIVTQVQFRNMTHNKFGSENEFLKSKNIQIINSPDTPIRSKKRENNFSSDEPIKMDQFISNIPFKIDEYDDNIRQDKINYTKKNNNQSIEDEGTHLLFHEKCLVGGSFSKLFLLLKYKVLVGEYTLIKNSIFLSKRF